MGVKFKAKQWNITKIKGTKFSDTNRCINIILGSLLQKDVNFGEIGRKVAGSAHKCSETNSSKVCNSNIQQITIKYSNSLADTGYIQLRTLAHQEVHLEFPSFTRVPSLYSECTCRMGVTKRQTQLRMETRYFSFSRDCNTHDQPTLDLLASRLCHQLPRYIARGPDPGSIAIDVLQHPWDRENSFAFPPFILLSQVLRKILKKKISHLIIVTRT